MFWYCVGMETELGYLGLSIKRIQARHHRVLDERLAPLGVSLVQWDALRHLHENPDASLHDLALLTFQTDQSCGALAARMIDRGLITRRPAGRAIRHTLTPQGERLRQLAGLVVDTALEESFSPLDSAQRAQLTHLLAKLLEDGQR